MSRTLSGLFLAGALDRPRERKRTNRENPRRVPEQIGKIPENSGKSQKGRKGTKKEGRVQIGKPPRLNPPPRLAALEPSIKNEIRGFARQGGFQKGGFGGCPPVPKTGTRVHSDVPRYQKPEQGCMRMFPGTKTGTRAHSPKPPFYETTLLFPLKKFSSEPHSKGLIVGNS